MDIAPYSIRCLMAIEKLVGSRQALADKMEVSTYAINRWVAARSIPKTQILKLIAHGEKKFFPEELLGEFDDEYSQRSA